MYGFKYKLLAEVSTFFIVDVSISGCNIIPLKHSNPIGLSAKQMNQRNV